MQDEDGSEREENTKANEEMASPTRAYLRAVSVPKKKPMRKRKKTTQDNGNNIYYCYVNPLFSHPLSGPSSTSQATRVHTGLPGAQAGHRAQGVA